MYIRNLRNENAQVEQCRGTIACDHVTRPLISGLDKQGVTTNSSNSRGFHKRMGKDSSEYDQHLTKP